MGEIQMVDGSENCSNELDVLGRVQAADPTRPEISFRSIEV
jgi:hypothetical protein